MLYKFVDPTPYIGTATGRRYATEYGATEYRPRSLAEFIDNGDSVSFGAALRALFRVVEVTDQEAADAAQEREDELAARRANAEQDAAHDAEDTQSAMIERVHVGVALECGHTFAASNVAELASLVAKHWLPISEVSFGGAIEFVAAGQQAHATILQHLRDNEQKAAAEAAAKLNDFMKGN